MTKMSCNRRRTALALLEALAALAVMSVLIAFVGQWTGALMQHRGAMARRQAAMRAMDNVVALAMAEDFSDVTAERLSSLAQPYTPRRAQWDIQVDDQPLQGPLLEKRLVIGLTFNHQASERIRPLVVWRYPTELEGTR